MSAIALINLSSLETMAVIGEIDRLSDASYLCFDDFDSYKKETEKIDGFIVTENEFIQNLDFFLPRKNKTILISRSLSGITSEAVENGALKIIGKDTASSLISEWIVSLTNSLIDEEELGELSSREKEVLRELASGKTNKEIADKLCISVNTVITHRKNVSAKLGIRSISGLSLYAVMNGII